MRRLVGRLQFILKTSHRSTELLAVWCMKGPIFFRRKCGLMTLRAYFWPFWKLSRIPFLPVGILPLILGFILAWRSGYRGPLGLYLLSMVTVILIMLMTYYFGVWNDQDGDRLDAYFNRETGRILGMEILPRRIAFLLGYFCLAGAIILGLTIYLRYATGSWTLLLGGAGIVSGFFYSNKPFRWASRGIGEILVAFCYGWLPIATGFYLFSGTLDHHVYLLAIPVALSVFNVILVNEFPDEEADRAVGKRNLVVRLGKDRMSDLYLGLSILAGFSLMKVMLIPGRPPVWVLVLSAVPLWLIVWNIHQVWKGEYRERRRLDALCRNTLWVNLFMTMILTIRQSLTG
jgi:1,4-dihydroxy-2-naphthoate polyprenyltransferase